MKAAVKESSSGVKRVREESVSPQNRADNKAARVEAETSELYQSISNFFVWNCQGSSNLIRFFENFEFRKYLVMGFVEMWLMNLQFLTLPEEYHVLSSPAIKTHTFGRPSGGILLLVKKSISLKIIKY